MIVRGGEYPLAEGETVRLSGGARITDWRPVQDAATLARMHPDARGHVLQADLAAHGGTDFGGPLYGSGSHTSDPGLEIFFRDKRMTVARYPNEGFLHIAELSVEDGYHVRGTPGSRTGRFRIDGEVERLRRWAAEPRAMLHGYWFWDWADQRMAVQNRWRSPPRTAARPRRRSCIARPRAGRRLPSTREPHRARASVWGKGSQHCRLPTRGRREKHETSSKHS